MSGQAQMRVRDRRMRDAQDRALAGLSQLLM